MNLEFNVPGRLLLPDQPLEIARNLSTPTVVQLFYLIIPYSKMKTMPIYLSIFCWLLVGFFSHSSLLASEEWSKAWDEDLAYYRSQVFEADMSYSNIERQKADISLANLEEHYSELSDPQIELELARISAITNNGHSFLMPGGWTHRYQRLPTDFRVFADGIFIISATEEY